MTRYTYYYWFTKKWFW